MTRVVLGSHIQSIIGSVGNLVFSEAKGVTTLRKKATTVHNPRTKRQQKTRTDCAVLVKKWVLFSAERKALWDEYAKQMRKELPGTDSKRKGGAGGYTLSYRWMGYLSGYNAFSSVNRIILSAGFKTYLLDAPKNVSKPCALTSFTVFYAEEEHCFRFFWEYDEECVPSDARVRIWAYGKKGRGTTRNRQVIATAPVTDMFWLLCVWPIYGGRRAPINRIWEFGEFLFQADVISPNSGVSPKTETVRVWVPQT